LTAVTPAAAISIISSIWADKNWRREVQIKKKSRIGAVTFEGGEQESAVGGVDKLECRRQGSYDPPRYLFLMQP
jgi:hypothetical protein